MNSFGQNLRKIREEQGLSMAELAKRVGTSRQTVHRYESGVISNIPTDRVELLATALSTSPSRLYGWEEEGEVLAGGMHAVPLLGDIACGEPITAEQKHGAYVMANPEIKPDFCLRAKGDSMKDARIHDGDIVFVRSQEMVEEGEMAAVIIDDEATLKRVYYDRRENRVVLMPANPLYPPMIYTGDQLENIRIIGRAVAFQSSL